MRGTLSCRNCPQLDCGIIPAYAGNTWYGSKRARRARDHPRVCGEHAPTGTQAETPTGSSPRMRGTLATVLLSVCLAGIIPAYAGNTFARPDELVLFWDHPRVCGEHLFRACRAAYVQGSSPRMRGTLVGSWDDGHSIGIIPAYAGNTFRMQFRCCRCRDHPRVCGEHLTVKPLQTKLRGSSPRMRGTH